MKTRLDLWLVAKGLAENQTTAQALIMTGKVRVQDHVITKPGTPIATDAKVDVQQPAKYVSRGGLKLEGAIKHFHLSLQNEVVLDVGASTGGFTDCLLQNGAKHVYCIDVGKHQLHEKLQNHPQVTWKESFHADQLTAETFGQYFSWVVMDVSFISIHSIMPHLVNVLTPNAIMLILFKPQFEASKKDLIKGVLRDDEVRLALLEDTIQKLQNEYHFTAIQAVPSSIKGPKGNQETLLYIQR